MLRHMLFVASSFCVCVLVTFAHLEISIALFVALSSIGNFAAV